MEQSTHNRPQVYSERQRVIVLTFATPDAARSWDSAGRPLLVIGEALDTTAEVA